MATSRAEKVIDEISEEFEAHCKKIMEQTGKTDQELVSSDPFLAGQAYMLFRIQAKIFAVS